MICVMLHNASFLYAIQFLYYTMALNYTIQQSYYTTLFSLYTPYFTKPYCAIIY